jgi:hypothetical protein
MLYPLFTDIWNEERFPSDWEESIIVKIPKKGDLSNCSNWRGTTLLATVSKFFNNYSRQNNGTTRKENPNGTGRFTP